jgi:hypothetical protein
MRKQLMALLIAAGFVSLAGPVGAASIPLTGSSLGISIGALPPLFIEQSPDPFPILVSSGTGGFTEVQGLFGPATIQVGKALFTGVASISGLTLTGFGNSTKVMAVGDGLPATAGKTIKKVQDQPDATLGVRDFGGNGALSGNSLVNVLQLFNLAIPLNAVGLASGFVTAAGGAIKITVTGTNWTTGVVQINEITTGVTVPVLTPNGEQMLTTVLTPTPNGGSTPVLTPNGEVDLTPVSETIQINTVTVSGFDNRAVAPLVTPNGDVISALQGQMQLISPFHVITNVAGNLPGFAIQVLNFMPEAGTVVLLGTGALGLAWSGSRRLRRMRKK